jgi:hypothetical protein
MEVGQGPNWGCSAKGKENERVTYDFPKTVVEKIREHFIGATKITVVWDVTPCRLVDIYKCL